MISSASEPTRFKYCSCVYPWDGGEIDETRRVDSAHGPVCWKVKNRRDSAELTLRMYPCVGSKSRRDSAELTLHVLICWKVKNRRDSTELTLHTCSYAGITRVDESVHSIPCTGARPPARGGRFVTLMGVESVAM